MQGGLFCRACVVDSGWNPSSGSITGAVAVITLFWHDWIEIIFGVDPDKGNGSAEWLVVVILLAVTSVLVLGVRLEWRRARPTYLAETDADGTKGAHAAAAASGSTRVPHCLWPACRPQLDWQQTLATGRRLP